MQFLTSLVALLLATATVFGQSISISKELYAVEIGRQQQIPLHNIYSISQDGEGYLYVSTNQGLFRYDGFQFQQLNAFENQYLGGANISFTPQLQLLYETFDGNIYTYQQDKWKRINQNNPIHFVNYGVTKDQLFCVQPAGIDIYDLHTKQLKRTLAHPIRYPQHTLYTHGAFYLITNKTLTSFDSLSVRHSVDLETIYSDSSIRQLYQDGEQIYVVPKSKYETGIAVFTPDLKYKHKIHLSGLHGIINRIRFINDSVWILTTSGIYVYKKTPTHWTFSHVHMKGANIGDMHIGKKGEYWISVLGKGLYLVPNPDQYVYQIGDERLTQISFYQEGYRAGTLSGKIISISPELKTAKVIAQSKFESPVHYLYQSPLYNSFFVVAGSGFSVQHSHEQQFFDNALKAVIQLDSSYSALATSSDVLLYRHSEGTSKHSIWNKLFRPISKHSPLTSLLNGKRSKAITYDIHRRRIYILNNVGLFYLTPDNEEHEIVDNNGSIQAERIVMAAQYLYLLNYSGQLIRYDGYQFSIVSSIKDRVYDIKSFGNYLILKTAKGLEQYDPITNHSTILRTDLHVTTVKDFIHSTDKGLLVATNEGLIRTAENSTRKPYDVTLFKVGGCKVNGTLTPSSQLKSLAYHQNSLEFPLALLDFSTPNPPRLAYRLNKGNWNELPSEAPLLQFHQLAAGKYTIDFKLDDVVVPDKLTFTIQPPFWQTWIFFLLMSILAIFTITVYYQKKRKKLNQHIKLLEDKIKLETKLKKSILTSIKAQMNPHFFFNALNSIQAFIFQNDQKQAISYLSKFSKLTRLILNQTGSEYICLQDEIQMLRLYLDIEALRFNHAFQYTISVDPTLAPDSIQLPAMLIQPYVENCIKHGFIHLDRPGEIQISFKKCENKLVVEVTDNGIGRVEAQRLQGHSKEVAFSTESNKKRLAILNETLDEEVSVHYADLYDENHQAKGTCVQLIIIIR